MPDKLPNHNEAGLLAFALVSRLIDSLIAKGLMSEANVIDIFESCAADFGKDSRGVARDCQVFLTEAAKARPRSK
jgi:hypothetical protein